MALPKFLSGLLSSGLSKVLALFGGIGGIFTLFAPSIATAVTGWIAAHPTSIVAVCLSVLLGALSKPAVDHTPSP